MPDLPAGTVTFLFTDIEGSTRLWERDLASMETAVERHVTLLRAATALRDSVGARLDPAAQAKFDRDLTEWRSCVGEARYAEA